MSDKPENGRPSLSHPVWVSPSLNEAILLCLEVLHLDGEVLHPLLVAVLTPNALVHLPDLGVIRLVVIHQDVLHVVAHRGTHVGFAGVGACRTHLMALLLNRHFIVA